MKLSMAQLKALALMNRGWCVNGNGFSYVCWEVRIQTLRSLRKMGLIQASPDTRMFKVNYDFCKLTRRGFEVLMEFQNSPENDYWWWVL